MTDQPAEQSSGFWTLTRPSKLSKRRNSDLHELHHKVFNICVVGLSGTEKDKGPIGIGKSCLCNRFVRSAADDYFTDHISVLSQSDFGGHVVNNDHWLYWGSVIKSCDGYDLAFNVIEQTEFVDDVCFQPFKTGKTEPYHKRCANTKLVSAEKLMYICKSQLGIEREYEQRYLPDGKFNVDGFLCLFDVSQVQGRNIDKQIEMTNLIMLSLLKTRKPVVFVTTKHDEANDLLLAEAERLVNQRDFRGLVPIVETSAQENVNINMAFLICAQLIDKSRTKLRVPPYFEAYRSHIELLKAANDAYLGLIRSTVHDYRSSWQQICIKLSHNPEFLQYTYLHGLDRASSVFKEHIKQLHEECISQKVQTYLKILPDVLEELLPRNISTLSNNNTDPTEVTLIERLNSSSSLQTWEETKDFIKKHASFNRYFIQLPDGVAWYDTDLLQSPDNRLPLDWLDSNEAFSIFKQRNLYMEVEQRRQFAKETFAQMLINLRTPVGKPFMELKHVFTGNVELEVLNDQELFDIYVDYQNNLLQKARADFQELLLENAEHLHHLTSNDKVIRQEDIKTINAILQHDERYQALDRFDQDRTLMMIRHLSFLHSQISEQCPSYPKCVEPEVERLLITKAKALVNKFYENQPDKSYLNAQKSCDLVIFGPRRPSQQLILALNVLNSRAPKGGQYQITFTVFDNCDDVEAQIQRFRQSNAKPKGCFGIFTNARSLDHVNYTLEKFLLISNSQAQAEKDHFGGPPVVMLYAADITLDERTMLTLENEGQQMSDKFKCPFMNVTAIDQYRQHQQNNVRNSDQDSASQVISECASLDYACVDAAFNVLKEAISRRVCFMELYNNQDLIPRQAFNPDARILLCLLCGEPFSNEQFLWRMFLESEQCYVTSSKSICVRMKADKGQDRFIGITITSYTHGALNYRDDLLHGFILVCSMQRKASLSVLNAFSFNIPCSPVLVIAVEDGNYRLERQRLEDPYSISRDDKDENEYSKSVEEARAASNRLKGDFEILNLAENNQALSDFSPMETFIRNVFRRKPAIDRAYHLGDNDLQSPISANNVNTASAKLLSAERFHGKTLSKSEKSINEDESHFKEFVSSRLGEKGCNTRDSTSTSSGFNQLQYSSSKQNQPQPHPRSQLNTRKLINKIDSPDTDDSNRYKAHDQSRKLPPIPQTQHKQVMRDNYVAASPIIDKSNELSSDSDEDDDINYDVEDDHDEDEENDLIDEEELCNGTGDDSADDKLDKPKKPGKLDLRQFDNITTAIGKLNVQPISASPTPVTSQASPSQKKHAPGSARSKASSTVKQQSISDTQTPNSRRLNNLRQGRAVAPPKLPTNLIFQNSLTRSGGSEKSSQNRMTQSSNGEESVIDFSQSPIAQRLLKHSKDYKVSELNSPNESDSESNQQSRSQAIKTQEVKRGFKNDKSTSGCGAPSESNELINTRGETIRQLNEILAKKPPGPLGPNMTRLTKGSSNDQLLVDSTPGSSSKKEEKDSKKDKKKLRSDEKLEKRKLKEEERLRRQEEEKLRRQEKKLASKKSKAAIPAMDAIGDDGIPLFIKCCIEFIESEGLEAEGIYRVPGNRAHVDTFVQKFKENPDMSILESDIPVNAVATALKDFLSKKWGPIIPLALMNELTELSNISNKKDRVEAFKELVNKLPTSNYKLLKYVFLHFVKVSSKNALNSMDSKNLAICWWPTLLPLHFNDMVMFEQMRPHLEESIQTMIDRYDFIFANDDPAGAST